VNVCAVIGFAALIMLLLSGCGERPRRVLGPWPAGPHQRTVVRRTVSVDSRPGHRSVLRHGGTDPLPTSSRSPPFRRWAAWP